MTDLFIFTVGGTPRAQPRPRFVKGRAVSTADPAAKLWRLAVDKAVRLALANRGEPLPLLGGALKVVCVFTFAPPTSAPYRKGRPHTQKPDASNLLKLVEDVMEDARVFGNDSTIAQPEVQKWWGKHTGVVVTVENMNEKRSEREAAPLPPPDWL